MGTSDRPRRLHLYTIRTSGRPLNVCQLASDKGQSGKFPKRWSIVARTRICKNADCKLQLPRSTEDTGSAEVTRDQNFY